MDKDITKRVFDTIDRIERDDLQRRAKECVVLEILRDCNHNPQELAKRLLDMEAA